MFKNTHMVGVLDSECVLRTEAGVYLHENMRGFYNKAVCVGAHKEVSVGKQKLFFGGVQ